MRKLSFFAALGCICFSMVMLASTKPLKPFLKSEGNKQKEKREVKHRAAAPETVVDENFSKFTAGSESEPVRIETDGYYLPDNLTNQPGWTGRGIAEAGGACAILYYESEWYGTRTGYLDTPEMYLYGETTLTFKAKAFNSNEGELWVPLCDAYDGPMDSKTFKLTDKWQEFSFTTSSATAYDNNYFQFTPEECEVLIDDVKIVVTHNKVQAPYTYAPENISLTSFRAGWESIVAPEKYLFNVFSKERPADFEQGSLFENFNTLNLIPGTGKIDTSNPGYPKGWKISTTGNVETGVGISGSSNGLVLSEEGEIIESPDTPLPIESFTFWVQPSNMNDEYYAYSLLQVSVCHDNGWEVIANLPNYWMEATGGLYVFENASVGEDASRIKLEYLQKGDMEVAFTITDITINYQSADVRVPYIEKKELPGNTNTEIVEGLSPEKNYYYTLQSVLGDLVSEESYPRWVDGIVGLSPNALPAENVNSNSFTAKWESLPHASEYQVKVQQHTRALEDLKDVTVIEEDFNKITEGSLEMPGWDFISPFDFGANGMANGDWQATQARWIVGMAGSAGTSWYGSAGIVASPYLTLTNDGGAFDVEFSALSTVENDVIFCMVIDNIDASEALDSRELELSSAYQLQSTKVHFSASDKNRKNVMIAFMSKSGEMFFVDDIRVSQNLKAGEALISQYAKEKAYGTSFTFNGLNETCDYSYTVTGSTNKDFIDYVSEPSNEIMVKIGSGVEKVLFNDPKWSGKNGMIFISGLNGKEHIGIFDMQGREIVSRKALSSECSFRVSPGIYILTIDGRSHKVNVSK